MSKIHYFAKTNFRHSKIFGIKDKDLNSHFLILGDKNSAKDNVALNIILQLLFVGKAVLIFDRSVDFSDKLLNFNIKPENIVQSVPESLTALFKMQIKDSEQIARELFDILKKSFKWQMSPSTENIFFLSLRTSLLLPDADFDTPFLLISDDRFRSIKLNEMQNRDIINYWAREFESIDLYNKKILADEIKIMQNSIRTLLSSKEKENARSLNMRKLERGKAYIFNFSWYLNDAEFDFSLLSTILQSEQLFENMQERAAFMFLDFQESPFARFFDFAKKAKKFSIPILFASSSLHNPGSFTKGFASKAFFRLSESVELVDYAHEFLALNIEKENLLRLGRKDFYLRMQIDAELSHGFSATALIPDELSKILGKSFEREFFPGKYDFTQNDYVKIKDASDIELPGAKIGL